MQEAVQEFADAIRTAAANRTPLCIRGSGSKDFYGGPLRGEILTVNGYRGIVDYEPSELVITARAGTPLAEIETTLRGQGQMLAFEPPYFDGTLPGGASPLAPGPSPLSNAPLTPHPSPLAPPPELPSPLTPLPKGEGNALAPMRNVKLATLGGCIAAGLSGPRRAYAGAVRDFVLGTRILDGQGTDLRFGGQVMKNVAGFDIARLMAGSLGTLGVILEVSLKVLPLPAAETTLRFEKSANDALAAVNAWAGLPLPISASAWSDGTLAIRLSGAASAVQATARKLGGEPIAAEAAPQFWQAIREHTASFFNTPLPLWRLSLKSTAPALNLAGAEMFEWGGALRWRATEADASIVRATAQNAGGHATLFRGGDKAVGVFQPSSPALMALQRRLKHAFDPAGILNPGRLYDY